MNFDDFARNYEDALARNLRMIPGGTSHYFQNRVTIFNECWDASEPPKKILDFGGGIGLTVPHLRAKFPESRIFLTDESQESLRVAAARDPSLEVVELSDLPEAYFDAVIVAGVIHHVLPIKRGRVIRQIARSLRIGGLGVIFELNPLNPVTRWLVRMCPFDENASLIRRSEALSLVNGSSNLGVDRSGYTVFFPPALNILLNLEKWITWCPLGAQYFVSFRKYS